MGVFEQLEAVAASGVLDSVAAPGAGALLQSLGVERLTVAAATANRDVAGATLTGYTTYRDMGWTIALAAREEAGLPAFTATLSLAGASSCALADAFPGLPPSRVYADGGLTAAPSVLAPLVVEDPAIQAMSDGDLPRLSGRLVLARGLAGYADFLGADRLPLHGTFDVHADPVALVLDAVASAAELDLPGVVISEIGLVLRSDYVDVYAIGDEPTITSAVLLYADLVVRSAGRPLRARLESPLLQGDFVWQLLVELGDDRQRADVAWLAGFLGLDALPALPPGVPPLDSFALTQLELGVVPPTAESGPELSYAAATVASDASWVTPIPRVTIEDLETRVLVMWGSGSAAVSGSIGGALPLTTEEDAPRLRADLEFPGYALSAATEGELDLSPAAAIEQLVGEPVPALPSHLHLDRISLWGSLSTQLYSAELAIGEVWTTTVGGTTFDVGELSFVLQLEQGGASGTLGATIGVSRDTAQRVFLQAFGSYGAGGWEFEGGLMEGPIDLLALTGAFLGPVVRTGLDALELDEMWATYSTADGNPFSVQATLAVHWTPKVLDNLPLSLAAAVALARRPKETAADHAIALAAPHRTDGEMLYEGSLRGRFTVGGVAVTVAMSFVDDDAVYLFEVAFGGGSVKAETSYVDTPAPRHKVLTISLTGWTLGGLVERLVALVNPNVNYRLDPPWDALNAIDLSRFTLVIDPARQTVRMSYALGLDLGFMTLSKVEVVYDRSSGSPGLRLRLDGAVLGKPYDGDRLSWDPINQAPPAVPGKGPSVLRIAYLGAGQHVALAPGTKTGSVGEVLTALRDQARPVDGPGGNPLAHGLRFDEASQWMVGLECTVLGTITIEAALLDPVVYGVVVSLAGPRAGVFAGLRLELLYAKVTDTVGVFRARVQVPARYRQFQIGAASLSLGRIGLDVYTNGGFLVDLGFPHGGDFSPSFGFQAGAFQGRGGVYFGRLDGATSSRVPVATNGTFDPVVVLGIGLAVGAGRSIRRGPLQAELSVELVAIVEGVFAWFHPVDAAAPVTPYHWARGSAAIVGKLYGSVDFIVVRASVTVEARASVVLTLEAFRQSIVELAVHVKVNAQAVILGIEASFSFEVDLSGSFTFGEDAPTPWRLGATGGPERAARRRRALLQAALPEALELSWSDAPVFPDGAIHPVRLVLVPAFSVAGVGVDWTETDPPGPAAAPDYRAAFVVMAENAVPAGASTIAETRRPPPELGAGALHPSETAFNTVIEAMLRWSLRAAGVDPVQGVVSAAQLAALAEQLDQGATADGAFAYASLSSFLARNLELRLRVVLEVPDKPVGGTAFPMPPPIRWVTNDPDHANDRDFLTYQLVDTAYEQRVIEYFRRLDPRPTPPAAAPARSTPPVVESMATFVFRDYFLMVAKAAVRAALDVTTAFPYRLSGETTESLSAICARFTPVTVDYVKHAGDTPAQVASFLGATTGELLTLDPSLTERLAAAAPGAVVGVLLGATPQGIAAANPDRPLVPKLLVPVGALVYQVGDGETLHGIAAALRAEVADLLESATDDPALLRPGADLAVPGGCAFPNAGGSLDLQMAAIVTYVRLAGAADIELLEWYLEAIAGLNAIVDGALPAEVVVPAAYGKLAPTGTWTTLRGDTLRDVAAYTALAQNDLPEQAALWLNEIKQLNTELRPDHVRLPPTTTRVRPGETLATLADRLPLVLPDADEPGTYLSREASFRALVRGAAILTPLARLTVRDCHVYTASDETLGGLAARLGLAVDELGGRLADVAGLLDADDGPLTIPHPGAAPVGGAPSQAGPADVVATVLADHAATISGQVARFMLNGLRLPVPGSQDGDDTLAGLYELTGQQLVAPDPSAVGPPPPWSVIVSAGAGSEWLKLYQSVTLDGDEPSGELLALNPGLARARSSTGGLAALTKPVAEIFYKFTVEDLDAAYPATALSPEWLSVPAPLPLHRDVGVRHALERRIAWQTTESVTLPNPHGAPVPLTGPLTIWPASSDLRASGIRYAQHDFALYAADPQLGPAAEATALSRYAWATLVELRVRRIPGSPKTFDVLGADASGADVLLALVDYLAGAAPGESAHLHLLFDAAAASGLPAGLVSLALDRDRTFLVKTNLSIETRSPSATGATATPVYSAGIAAGAAFATLLWECSVVGGGGYWLQYTAAAGGGLPDAIFGTDGTARLTLLVTLASQTGTSPSRRLHPFTTCAVVGETVDAGVSSLFARTVDGAETSRQATVAPGNVGFELRLQRPQEDTPFQDEKQLALRRLYSMIGYRLREHDGFAGSGFGLSVGPAVGGSDEGVWELLQVLPIHRFATAHPAPAVAGLPSPLDDPYAGIVRTGTASDARPRTQVELRFRDLLGNDSRDDGDAASGGPLELPVPVGYTDPLVAVTAWPATTATFRFEPATAGAKLIAALAPQTAAHVAAAGHRGGDAARSAAEHLDRFERVYFQLERPDVSAALLTTLEEDAAGPVRLAVPMRSLRDLAAASCAWLGAASRLGDVPLARASAKTPAQASASYGAGYAEIAAANAAVPVAAIFGPTAGGFAIPRFAVFRDGDTVASVCGADAGSVLAGNATLPLRPGVELVLPGREWTVPDDVPPVPPPTLAEVAAEQHVTLASLIEANATTDGLLRIGAVFACEGVEVEVSTAVPDVSFDDVAATFEAEGVPFDAVMVAGANADVPGLLRPGAVLAIDRYEIGSRDTLAKNDSGSTAAVLAPLNVGVPDLFPSGTSLYTGSATTTGDDLLRPLGEVAAIHDIDAGTLLEHNAEVPFGPAPAGPEPLAVPGQSALPADPAALRIPFRIPAGATLAGLAPLFLPAGPGGGPAALAAANLHVPGVVAGGVTVTVDKQPVTTHAGDSFASLLARFDPSVTLDALVAAIASQVGVLATGALLLTPPAKLSTADPAGVAPAKAAAALGVAVRDLALPNAALSDLVVPNVTLVSPDGGAEITTGKADALNSLVWRFAQKSVTMDVGAILEANQERQLLRAGAAALLAPPVTELTVAVGAGTDGWRFPSTVFPVRVWLDVERDAGLVDPAFRGTPDAGPVERARSVLPPPAPAAPGDALGVRRLAADLQAAVPPLRVATGHGGEASDLWAVAFGPDHLEKVAVAPPADAPGGLPRFFALRPLANSLVAPAGVPISPLKPDGTLGPAVATDLQSLDLESLATRLLADVDQFLSAPYATGAHAVAATLDRVIAAKAKLAGAILGGIDDVLDPSETPTPTAARESAAHALLQRLLTSLSAGYAANVVVQYEAQVVSPWSTGWARLSGTADLPDATAGERQTSISGAKTSLANGTSYVNFVVRETAGGRRASVVLPLRYAVGEMEIGVAKEVEGYERSDWLSFVLPFDDPLPPGVAFDLGTPSVPLPLRSYPSLPTLVGQWATPSTREPVGYADALEWDYSVRFEHTPMAQDRLHLEVELNRAAASQSRRTVAADALPAKLARYVAVADDLWKLLEPLTTRGVVIDQTLTNAMATFATLVEEAATAWQQHWTSPSPTVAPAPPAAKRDFTIALGYELLPEEGWRYSFLDLTSPQGDVPVGWPEIGLFFHDGTFHSLGEGKPTTNGRRYFLPAGIVAFAPLGFELVFRSLHVGSVQNAAAAVHVSRNARLLPGLATRPGFVYQTRPLAFPAVTTPLLSPGRRFAIGPWSDVPKANPLQTVLDAVFDGDDEDRAISLGIAYGYELAPGGDDPIVTRLPVKLRPKADYDPMTVTEVVDAVVAWRGVHRPATAGGEWIFELSLYSSLDGSLHRPLLQLDLYSAAAVAQLSGCGAGL
jgi:hypothetical protein